MSFTAFTGSTSPLWPLGKITVAASGTAVALNTNVGAQTQTSTSAPTRAVRQLILTAPAGNTGLTYLLLQPAGGGASKTTTNFVVAALNPGETRYLPEGLFGVNIDIDSYVVDADTTNNVLYASAVVA